MSMKSEGLLGDIKTLVFCIIQCKLKICISILVFTFYIINQIYLIIFNPNYPEIFNLYGGVATASEQKSCTYRRGDT